MTELTVSQIIKISLGLLVVVAVVAGASLYFKGSVFGFFEGLGNEDNVSTGEVDLSGYEAENLQEIFSVNKSENTNSINSTSSSDSINSGGDLSTAVAELVPIRI